jgi:hypothetical protein
MSDGEVLEWKKSKRKGVKDIDLWRVRKLNENGLAMPSVIGATYVESVTVTIHAEATVIGNNNVTKSWTLFVITHDRAVRFHRL